MKLYEKIKRPDNYDKFKEPFKKGEKITIQEKIDGSNTGIMNVDGKLVCYSRTQKLKDDDGNFKQFIKFVKDNEENILKYLGNGEVIFGEWLGMAKITYNSKAKQGLIPRYYVFDIAKKIENIEDEEKINRIYYTPEESEFMAKNMLLPFTPVIEKEIELEDFNSLLGKYVESKPSLLDSDCMREGIVIKSIDGTKRVKIVASQFREVKVKKIKALTNENEWLNKFITPMRVEKYLQKLKEQYSLEEIKPEQFKLVFKNLDLISEDIFEEEFDLLKKSILKLIKKQAVPAIKDYLLGVDKNE